VEICRIEKSIYSAFGNIKIVGKTCKNQANRCFVLCIDPSFGFQVNIQELPVNQIQLCYLQMAFLKIKYSTLSFYNKEDTH